MQSLIHALLTGYRTIFTESNNNNSMINYVDQYLNKLPEKIKKRITGNIIYDDIMEYMDRYDKNVITDSDAETIAKFKWNEIWNSLDETFKSRRIEYVKEMIDGVLNKHDIKNKIKEIKDDYIDYINISVSERLQAYNFGRDIVLEREPKLNVIIPSIASIIIDVVESIDEHDDTVILYVYAGNDPSAEIGISIDLKNELIEIFEENDESNDDTIEAIIRLTSDPDEYVTVYSAQPETNINNMIRTGDLPSGMFVSPDKNYAAGYLFDGRDLIQFKLQNKYIEKHSPYDWKIRKNAKATKIKYI